jgi:hypothetical protein
VIFAAFNTLVYYELKVDVIKTPQKDKCKNTQPDEHISREPQGEVQVTTISFADGKSENADTTHRQDEQNKQLLLKLVSRH